MASTSTFLSAPTDLPSVYSNLGPLTTIYTGPPSCATPQPYFSEIVDNNQNLLAADCDSSDLDIAPNAAIPAKYFTCLPYSAGVSSILSAAFAKQTGQDEYAYTTNYYSPGLDCPAGYKTATSFTLTASPASQSATNAFVPVTGTHIVCCPSAYNSFNTDYGYCVSTATAATTITNLCRNDCTMGEFCSTPAPFVFNPSQSATVTVEAGLAAVYMVHQKSDVPTGSSSAMTGASAATTTGVQTATMTTSAAGSATPTTKTGGARKANGLGLGAMASMMVLATFVIGTCAL